MEDQEVDTSAAEAEARGLGWVPEEEFRGDKAKWVDAETFVKRGKEQLPILLENNKRLKSQVGQLTSKLSQLETLFQGSQIAIEELKHFHEETFNARVKAERERLKAEIVAARKEDDVQAELDARERLDNLNEEVRDVTPPKKKDDSKPAAPAPKSQDNVDSPAFVAWRSANPWFLTDPRKASMAFGLANQIRAENPSADDTEFFRLLDEAIDDQMPSVRNKPVTSKVEPNRGGSGGGGGGSKTYSSLPADAKAVCDRQSRNLVGPGKAFKDIKEWQTHYTKLYYEQDAS